jgi:hypothetical protein
MMQAIVEQMCDSVSSNLNDITTTITNNNDSLRAEINNNNTNINEKFETMQALNDASRLELLGLIEQRSSRSTRNSTRAPSRSISPTTLVSQVNAKLCSDADEQEAKAATQAGLNDVRQRSRASTLQGPAAMMLPVADTPRVPNARPRQKAPAAPNHVNEIPQANSFGPELTWTAVLGGKEAADKFAEENIGRRQQ